MNEDNRLNLKIGSHGRVMNLVDVGKVFLPCSSKISNARVVEVEEDGSVNVHWKDNFNLDGDFRSELMSFDSNLVFNEEDLVDRNRVRRENGLVEIK